MVAVFLSLNYYDRQINTAHQKKLFGNNSNNANLAKTINLHILLLNKVGGSVYFVAE